MNVTFYKHMKDCAAPTPLLTVSHMMNTSQILMHVSLTWGAIFAVTQILPSFSQHPALLKGEKVLPIEHGVGFLYLFESDTILVSICRVCLQGCHAANQHAPCWSRILLRAGVQRSVFYNSRGIARMPGPHGRIDQSFVSPLSW